MKPKFQEKLLLNYMRTDSFIYTIKTDDFYKDIRNDIEAKFDTSDYSDERINLLYITSKELTKKVWGFLKMSLTVNS